MICEFLATGKDNAIPARELASMLGISIRDVAIGVERDRRAGVPICASCDSGKPGYFLAADEREMIDYCNRLLHRIREIRRTYWACMRAADDLREEDKEQERKKSPTKNIIVRRSSTGRFYTEGILEDANV